jgi:hypothetical protein
MDGPCAPDSAGVEPDQVPVVADELMQHWACFHQELDT